MAGGADADRELTLTRMARSRARLCALLDADDGGEAGGTRDGALIPGQFPRSRTMRLLISRQGARTAMTLGAGLLLARPAAALRILKMLPLGAIARMLLLRFFTAK